MIVDSVRTLMLASLQLVRADGGHILLGCPVLSPGARKEAIEQNRTLDKERPIEVDGKERSTSTQWSRFVVSVLRGLQ